MSEDCEVTGIETDVKGIVAEKDTPFLPITDVHSEHIGSF
jgi:hypothetical protein